MERLLSVDDVAELTGLSETTVWSLLRSGELRGLKLRGRWRVEPADLAAYLDECRVVVTEPIKDTGSPLSPRPRRSIPPGGVRAAIRESRRHAA